MGPSCPVWMLLPSLVSLCVVCVVTGGFQPVSFFHRTAFFFVCIHTGTNRLFGHSLIWFISVAAVIKNTKFFLFFCLTFC